MTHTLKILILLLLVFNKIVAQDVFYEGFEGGSPTLFRASPYFKDMTECNGWVTTGLGSIPCHTTNFDNLVTADATQTSGRYFLFHGTYYASAGVSIPGEAWGTLKPISVSPKTYYTFSFYLANFFSLNPAQIQPQINGVNLGNPASAAGTGNGSWTKFSFCWYSNTDTFADLSLMDLLDTADGNDFGIDEIRLTKVPTIHPRNRV